MSDPAPATRERQEKMHAHLETAYKEFRLERDRIQETVLWLLKPEQLPKLCMDLRDDKDLLFDRLSDITAYDNVDQKDGQKRFVGVYQLYSMKHHIRLRLKVLVGEEEPLPTVTPIWKAANWLEREVYDLFGIRYEGHPDLRRIMMDERFQGYPLRKEYELKDRQPFNDSLPARLAPHGPTERLKDSEP
ncbi:MAG TPA: NADH-quinone oxidoreductase subunit C [Oligoflexus sp.]|uniref:NADH-quinone oxidoreductase subunit C n=1 Tax=Oligoflexus sp. TaxID=1971216 RepID=UPI002D4E80B1|nr:NADH-quinone oxidoreductase subunit C [Oligoflexus sp.]HYX35721.1 NADH-quinone oxidoreductase subunit C [Oligoflexus sp.]